MKLEENLLNWLEISAYPEQAEILKLLMKKYQILLEFTKKTAELRIEYLKILHKVDAEYSLEHIITADRILKEIGEIDE